MDSYFGPPRPRREINLGNASSSSLSSILSDARARRTIRQDQKRRHESALRIQSWWRGRTHARNARNHLRQLALDNVGTVQGLRALVLVGNDDQLLATWANAILDGKPFEQHPYLTKRLALLLFLQSLDSPHAILFLQLLSRLVTQEDIMLYLVHYDLFKLLAQAIYAQPKESPSLPHLVSLAVHPFTLLAPSSSLLNQFTAHILSIPLLPNRLPIPVLSAFAPRIPLQYFYLLNPQEVLNNLSNDEQNAHLLANLAAFVPPRYSSLSPPSILTYLNLLTALLTSLPERAFDPPTPSPDKWPDSEDDGEIIVHVVDTFDLKRLDVLNLDQKTMNRLHSLTAPQHLSSLLSAGQKLRSSPKSTLELHAPLAHPDPLIALLSTTHALTLVHPSRRDRILTAIMAQGGASSGIVRELWKAYVRGSPVGKEASNSKWEYFTDSSTASHWPPLLYLTELYTHVLLTMGDDEFFSSSPSHVALTSVPLGGIAQQGSVALARNPLTLDELKDLSRRLLNIAFVLWWRDDPSATGPSVSGTVSFSTAPSMDTSRTGTPTPSPAGTNDLKRPSRQGTLTSSTESPPGLVGVSWDTIRERITRCLQSIHARDSRKPFMSPDHWLVTSHLDVGPFIEAAVYDERSLSSSQDLASSIPASKKTRYAASLTPRLNLLTHLPFTLPFPVRVSILRHFIANDRLSHGLGVDDTSSRQLLSHNLWGRSGAGSGVSRVTIRRGHVAEDGFGRLDGVDLRAPVAITFVDQWGQEEAGIDGGGVFKEFLTSLTREVFDTDRGLWLANKRNELYPNPHAYATESHSLSWYRFIGRILGKALYEGILVDVAFATFFFAKWLGKQSFLDDLASLDPDLYQGLLFLKHYNGNPDDLALNFTISVEEFGVTKTVPLIPNGEQIPVTRENRLQYIYLVSYYRLNKQIKKQSDAFFEGLTEMIDPKWLRMFNQQELQILLGGADTPIDLSDLQANTLYGGAYDGQHVTIQMFWRVVNGFNQEQRMALLRFVTSCSRPPLLGFKELVPHFAIRDSGQDETRLPTASTCVNLLKLPQYRSERQLKEKLLQAIYSGAGFDLS